MDSESRILIAGYRGLVGSAIVRRLQKEGYKNLLLLGRDEIDFTQQSAVYEWFQRERPEYVFLAAARVGGIVANRDHKAEFIFQNLSIQTNVIHGSWLSGVKKLLFLGSSCIYPRDCPQPIREDYLMTGPLEPSNDAYALAKIAGIKMCQSYNQQYGTDYIAVMPTNLYGMGDNFDLQTSHVLPAMLRKFHEAKNRGEEQVGLWGSGAPRREFLHVDDLADALLFLMNNYSGSEIVNIGTGTDIAIRELAGLIKDVVGYNGEIVWDTRQPDGTPRKLLDVSKLNGLGWTHRIKLEDGIRMTYEWFKESHVTK